MQEPFQKTVFRLSVAIRVFQSVAVLTVLQFLTCSLILTGNYFYLYTCHSFCVTGYKTTPDRTVIALPPCIIAGKLQYVVFCVCVTSFVHSTSFQKYLLYLYTILTGQLRPNS